MKKPSATRKHRLTINTVEASITNRARKVVQRLVDEGTPIDEIARCTDTTILALLDGASPRLGRPQYMALFKHFDVNPLWLWTGHGPEFISPADSKVLYS